MSNYDFVSNTPISKPSPIDAPPDVDFNGLMWSNKWGFVFGADDEMDPLKPPPAPPPGGRGGL